MSTRCALEPIILPHTARTRTVASNAIVCRSIAYAVVVTCAMMAPLGSLAAGVPHGHGHSAAQFRGPLACGTGGGPQAPGSTAPRYLLRAIPRPSARPAVRRYAGAHGLDRNYCWGAQANGASRKVAIAACGG